MRTKWRFALLAACALWLAAAPAQAQSQAPDLGPHFRTVKEGVHVYASTPIQSNCTIILTSDGVVLIDSGHNPPDSRAVMAAIRKLTALPVRLLINTEPHADHTSGHFVFSPPAVVVAAAGAGDSMRRAHNPRRWEPQLASAPSAEAMRKALEGYRQITPHVEYRDRMTLSVGERTFELHWLKNVHSEADTAIWMPKERILFTAASVSVNRFNNLRPFVSIADTLAAIKMMRALNPEIVIAGHGPPGTVKILDDMERYYILLLERVRRLAEQGKSLDEIKAELKMPEYDHWVGKDRYPNNIEAAYREVKGR